MTLKNAFNSGLLVLFLVGFGVCAYGEETTTPSTQPDVTGTVEPQEPATDVTGTAEPQEPATDVTGTAEPQEPAMSETPALKSEHVLRALLTTGIENREPVDEIMSLDKNQGRIYFFTEFSGLKGQVVNHRWEYNGKPMGEVNFNIGSNKWRCYSSKNILPEWTGIWTVSVIDENENVLAKTYFEVTE